MYFYKSTKEESKQERNIHVIAWVRGQLKIDFTNILKVFTKLPKISRKRNYILILCKVQNRKSFYLVNGSHKIQNIKCEIRSFHFL